MIKILMLMLISCSSYAQIVVQANAENDSNVVGMTDAGARIIMPSINYEQVTSFPCGKGHILAGGPNVQNGIKVVFAACFNESVYEKSCSMNIRYRTNHCQQSIDIDWDHVNGPVWIWVDGNGMKGKLYVKANFKDGSVEKIDSVDEKIKAKIDQLTKSK